MRMDNAGRVDKVMQIYTSVPFSREAAETMRKFHIGLLFCPSGEGGVAGYTKELAKHCPVAMDNGAYKAWEKGRGFDEYQFLRMLSMSSRLFVLSFVVCPDIVAGGMKSFDFSLRWRDRLAGWNNLYLVVQDGMTPNQICLGGFSGLFIGGTVKWKWETAEEWIDWAHGLRKPVHIGRVSDSTKLKHATLIGANSCDSANFVRDGSWHHIEEYVNPKQDNLL